jgi:hypothetical protein
MRARPLEQVEQEHEQKRDDDPERQISEIVQGIPSFIGRAPGVRNVPRPAGVYIR